MKTPTLLASATSLLATFSLLPLASANCAMPVSYVAKISANTVTVEPRNFGERGCPDSAGMLRENVATGQLVKLADYCSGVTKPGSVSESASSAAYVDECVPAGKYRYGFAKPYACHGSSCSTDYFTEAVVQSALETGCKRSPGNAAPVVAYSAPWPLSGGQSICGYRPNTGNPATGGAPSTTVTAGGAPGVAGSNGNPSSGSSAVAGSNGNPSGGSGAVAGSNGNLSGGSGAVAGSNGNPSGGSGAVANSNVVPSGGSAAVPNSNATLTGGSGTVANSKGNLTGGSGTVANSKGTRSGASGATAGNVPSNTDSSSQVEGGNDSDSGCSITAPPGTTAVVAVNLATILLGLLLSRRRRRQSGE